VSEERMVARVATCVVRWERSVTQKKKTMTKNHEEQTSKREKVEWELSVMRKKKWRREKKKIEEKDIGLQALLLLLVMMKKKKKEEVTIIQEAWAREERSRDERNQRSERRLEQTRANEETRFSKPCLHDARTTQNEHTMRHNSFQLDWSPFACHTHAWDDGVTMDWSKTGLRQTTRKRTHGKQREANDGKDNHKSVQ
jgi:acyl transferase domain-containing protein